MDENIIYVGNKKPTSGYILDINRRVMRGATKITIKARGRATSKAIDVAEACKNRFLDGWEYTDILIGTEVQKVKDKKIRKPDGSYEEIILKEEEQYDIRLSTLELTVEKTLLSVTGLKKGM